MNGIMIFFSQAMRRLEVLMETALHFIFLTTTKSDVEDKIEKLNEDRQNIILRHSVIQKVIRLRKHGISFDNMELINNTSISKGELKAIYDNVEAMESALNAEQARVDENKNATIVNLYLLNQKKKLLNTKLISVLIMIVSAITIIFFSIPFWTVSIGFILYVLYELKDQIISYRVTKGYFGTTTSEAIDLIKFIRKNIDKIDSDDGTGSKRKIFNPIKQNNADDSKSHEELPNV